ncbi:MAG: hypothetical protein AABZ32_04975, partial [Bacteroidota bacterium]
MNQKISPTLQKKIKTQRTVLTRTDIALNVNRFEQSFVRSLNDTASEVQCGDADNIKIKRNKFFWGFDRNLKVSASNKQLLLMKVY